LTYAKSCVHTYASQGGDDAQRNPDEREACARPSFHHPSFCLLIRREVIDAIGLLDERFGLGCFEDDDYTLRAIQAGYRAVVAVDALIHHYGGRTFVGSGIDTGAWMQENQRRFLDKWAHGGSAADSATTVGRNGDTAPSPRRKRPRPFAFDVAPGGGLRLRIDQERPYLSLCMIVRDSARTLPACLESIRPWVDEMVIVDTGSVDDTPRIVETFGGRLFHFPWCDDFSAARNESLRHARGEWLFWMDSDDMIPPECGRKLRDLVERGIDPRVTGFVMQVHCPGGREDGGPEFNVTVVDHVKLFRNRPAIRFDGRIHEQLLPSIRRSGVRSSGPTFMWCIPARTRVRRLRRRNFSATCACSSWSWRSGLSTRSHCSTWE
jgi:hypothetical protein